MSFNLAKLLALPSKPIPITAQDVIIKFWTDFENAKSRVTKTGYIITWIIPEELSNRSEKETFLKQIFNDFNSHGWAQYPDIDLKEPGQFCFAMYQFSAFDPTEGYIKSYPVNENYAYSGITHIYYYL